MAKGKKKGGKKAAEGAQAEKLVKAPKVPKPAKAPKPPKAADEEKLPKRIAGVKIPKELRSPAARAMQLMGDHPVISEAVAAGMLAAAAALVDPKEGNKAKTVLKAAAAAVGGRLVSEAKSVVGLGTKPEAAEEPKRADGGEGGEQIPGAAV